MPCLEEHCRHTLKRFGVEGREIHSWLDEPSKLFTTSHRQFRHDTETVRLAGKLFGEKYGKALAENIALDHIMADHEEEIKKRSEAPETVTLKISQNAPEQPKQAATNVPLVKETSISFLGLFFMPFIGGLLFMVIGLPIMMFGGTSAFGSYFNISVFIVFEIIFMFLSVPLLLTHRYVPAKATSNPSTTSSMPQEPPKRITLWEILKTEKPPQKQNNIVVERPHISSENISSQNANTQNSSIGKIELWKCSQCGYENDKGSVVCDYCGASRDDDIGDSGDNRDSEDLFFDEYGSSI